MANAKRRGFMANVNWNQFRKLHHGIDKKEISKLWKEYKAGEYTLPSNEEAQEPVKATSKKVAKKAAKEVAEENPMKSFAQLFNDVFNNPRLTPEEVQSARHSLAKVAQATGVKGYVCKPTDGWKLWIGPTKAAVLCNESQDIAFACNRGYWHTFYHGASLCYVETCAEADTVHRMADYFRKRDRFVERVPIPSYEIMLPASKLEIINTASGSWNP